MTPSDGATPGDGATLGAEVTPAQSGTGGVEPVDAPWSAGIGGRLERLWTPYRMAYVTSAPRVPRGGCVLCSLVDEPEDTSLVVARGPLTFAVLNLHPYNPGHTMVLPNRHVAGLDELTDAEAYAIVDMTRRVIRAIRRVSNPEGFNVGYNLGSVAGGSLAAHLHEHIVPRWGGDANFMTVTAGAKVLPQLLQQTRDLLREALETE